MESIDTYISKIWNEKNDYEHIVEEHVWGFCRILEEKSFLIGDSAPISTISIGPFKIASTIDISKKEMLTYFLETIVPMIFSKANGLPFKEVYVLYLVPMAELFLDLVDKSYWVKDSLQWEIIIFIREKNKDGIYPTKDELKEADYFRGVEEWQIDNAINGLEKFETILGDKHSLIQYDFDNRLKCIV